MRLWAWQWKRQFNVNKTEEVVFSCKKRKPFHPQHLLGNDEVERKSEHKHLGMQLDSELNFLSHIKEAIGKARRGIGMIRFLSKYVARDVLDQIYKLYVRPHLDYGDIIYHKYGPEMRLTLSTRQGHMAQQHSLRTANFSGGKAFGSLIDVRRHAHCIYLLLTESLIMIPPGKR